MAGVVNGWAGDKVEEGIPDIIGASGRNIVGNGYAILMRRWILMLLIGNIFSTQDDYSYV